MTSPYLNRPLRTQAEVARDMLTALPETYIPVSALDGQLVLRETAYCQTLRGLVFDIANGEYDAKNHGVWENELVAILRLIHDEKPENVTKKVASEVLEYIKLHDHLTFDQHGYLIDHPFLDDHLPDWRDSLPPGRVDREFEHRDLERG